LLSHRDQFAGKGSHTLWRSLAIAHRVVAPLARYKPGRRLEANIEMDAALLLRAERSEQERTAR
jgi:hypothetical protein